VVFPQTKPLYVLSPCKRTKNLDNIIIDHVQAEEIPEYSMHENIILNNSGSI
jgi:hypothetical protein